jgi:hypothetical protein
MGNGNDINTALIHSDAVGSGNGKIRKERVLNNEGIFY